MILILSTITLICNSVSLIVPSASDVFFVVTDASAKGIGGVLDKEVPVGFYLSQMQRHDEKFAATELKCLAVVDTIKHFEAYLWTAFSLLHVKAYLPQITLTNVYCLHWCCTY